MDIKLELEHTLSQHENFLVEGHLNKNKLSELARKYDPFLLKVLMNNEILFNYFFVRISDYNLVFKMEMFLQFINNKEFLPDSFTRYKTKIGLGYSDGKYLSENNEIVLNFPFKDCILEGGQKESDIKRKEVFFNEIIAPTEITRLLDDKVLVNFKKYDSSGIHPVSTLQETDNFIIKGNNLIALHSLKKRFGGKVKLIYIDPPYNTGSDDFNYNDNFNHSTWLTFMKNRFEVAKELLRPDGVIFVQCDDNEQAYLKVLMDMVFGRDNAVATIHCQMSTTQGMKVKAAKAGNIVKNSEYILVFGKYGNKAIAQQTLYDIRQDYDTHYSKYIKEDGKIYSLEDIYDFKFPNDVDNVKALDLKEAYNSSKEFREFVKNNLDNIVRYDKVTGFDISNQLKHGTYEVICRDGKEYLLTLNSKNKIQQLLRLSDSWGETDSYKKPIGLRKIRGDWWEEFYLDMGNINSEGGVKFSNGKKPERLIQQIIKMTTVEGDIVLDYHLGSGTTASVAHKMNRQYVGVEQMDYIESMSVERLKKVIDGDQSGISEQIGWRGGGSFVYCELKSDAQEVKEKIHNATESAQLVSLLNHIKNSSFLSYRVNTNNLKHEEFSNFSLAEQKQLLFELIDNNNLYVNYSDIDDLNYAVSSEDKVLNRQFYGGD